MKIEIKHRWTGEVLFSTEAISIRVAVENAIEAKADLSKADLSEANLSEADLSEADLSKANLSKANLSWANLSEANLSKANLSEADLSEADLSKANLSWANLSKANLSKADLSEANLSEADLSEADLSKANLSWAKKYRADIFKVLDLAPNEVAGLRSALAAGNVDGSCYEGACACLVGTIANVRNCPYTALGDLKPDSSRDAEKWFMRISPGFTPGNSGIVKITVGWIDEWIAARAGVKEANK